MRDTLPSGLRGYLVAVAATAAAVAVRWLVDPWLGDKLALVTLPAAVVVTVWVGGYRPALLAAAAGYVACARLFGRPSAGPGSDVSELLGLFVYMSSCSIILAIGEAMRRARQRQAFLWGTLGSIGDAVITTDTDGRITFMNAVAESLTGWSHRDAAGRPLVAVFRIADERTRETVENPAKRALREGAIVGLANHSVLVARDGAERPIDDSAAPIRDEGGRVVGCVLIFRDITDRRHAELTLQRSEGRLRESEQRLRLALEAGRMGAWEWSAATNRVAWSPTLEAIHGLEPGTFGGTFEAYQQAVHPGDVERVCASIARAMEGGVEHHVEYRIVRRDGSVRWVEDWGRVVAGPDGAPAGIVGICADITERRRAEQARKESEERFVRFMGYLPGLAWIKDLQGRYVFANEAALKAFRTPAREGLYGRTDEEVFPPETAARFAENDRRALATGTAVQVVELLAHEDGTFHQSIVIKFPIPAPDGEAAWVGGIAIDVTEQRRVEGALRDSEARLRAVFDTVVDGIITINESGTMESVNPAAERLFGYSAAELLGRNVSMLMPDPYRREHDSYLESYRRTGQRKVIGIGREVVGLRKDGTQFPMDLGVSELSLGGRRMFTGLVRDVTERKRAEDALREADRRKTEFLATLAHELRNPLAPIRNSLEILKRAEGDPRARRQGRETIERQLGHLVRLVDDLVDVSRITRDRLELRRTRVELASVVHDAVETCRPLAEREEQAIELALPERPVYLEADPVRLVQVFGNLLNNACKYTPRGGTIRVATARRGGDVLVSVKDSGIGIPPEKLESVFDMFAQLEPPAERSRVGLGIGLTLAKRLVELHGGTIEARSEGLGRGSAFVVRLPVAAERPEGRESAATIAAPHGVAPLRVLVVDDNEDSAASLSKLLSLAGHETRTAHDGLTTVEAAELFRPDVVLLDIGLPKLSGLDVCRRIREQPWGRSMVMIALTGWGQKDDRDQSRHAGFDGHLVKPVAHDDLMRLLDSLLPEPRGGQPEA